MNWEALREAIKNEEFKFSSMVAVMPRHPPARIMTAHTDGIEPLRGPMAMVRTLSPKSKYYEGVKMSREMNGQTVENGIYQTRHQSCRSGFRPDRNVYIQDGSVQLVNDEERTLFAYDWFFRVNQLGPKISDLPEGVNIKQVYEWTEQMSAAQLIFDHHQKLNERFTKENA